MTKIKEDEFGLYVIIGGWICRVPGGKRQISEGATGPEIHWLEGTKFKAGENIRGSHPAGQSAYLRKGKRGESDYYMEPWDVVCLSSETEERIREFHNKREQAIEKWNAWKDKNRERDTKSGE